MFQYALFRVDPNKFLISKSLVDRIVIGKNIQQVRDEYPDRHVVRMAYLAENQQGWFIPKAKDRKPRGKAPICPVERCQSSQIIANGYSTWGSPKWKCSTCNFQFTENAKKRGGQPIGDKPMPPAEIQKKYRKRPWVRDRDREYLRQYRAKKRGIKQLDGQSGCLML